MASDPKFLVFSRTGSFSLLYIYLQIHVYFQPTVVCSPKDGDIGGIPAGCQCDLGNNIWIADMRLGILKMDQNGKYQQVRYEPWHNNNGFQDFLIRFDSKNGYRRRVEDINFGLKRKRDCTVS